MKVCYYYYPCVNEAQNKLEITQGWMDKQLELLELNGVCILSRYHLFSVRFKMQWAHG